MEKVQETALHCNRILSIASFNVKCLTTYAEKQSLHDIFSKILTFEK